MDVRRTVAIVVAIVVLAVAGFVVMRQLNGKSSSSQTFTAPPTVATAIVQPNGGETIHIVTSLPTPAPAPPMPKK